MTIGRALLKIKGLECDILRVNQKFQRDVDARGRPRTNYYGGEIVVEVESTDDIRLFQQMIHKEMPTVDGSIEMLSDNGEDCVRRIDFKQAYICTYGEEMQRGSQPMTTIISISPMRLDYNNNMLRLDRLWPQAPHGWQKYVEEAPYVRPAPQAPPTPLITAVKGESTALFNTQVEYRATNYNLNVSPEDRNRVRWMVEVDGKQELQKQQGETLKLTMQENWIDKKLIVMPYLKKPNPDVSVETQVTGYLRRKIVYIHGTKADAGRWDNLPNTINCLNKIALDLKPDEKSVAPTKVLSKANICYTADWEGGISDGKSMYNELNNTVLDRRRASDKLYAEIIQWKEVGDFDEIVLIGHSHGGNVAIQVADRLAQQFDNVFLLTVATPAQNKNTIEYRIPNNSLKELFVEDLPMGIGQPRLYVYQNPENPGNLTHWDKIHHIALYNPKDLIDELALAFDLLKDMLWGGAGGGGGMTFESDMFTCPKTRNEEIKAGRLLVDLKKAHSFDATYSNLIEAANIKPWPRTVKDVKPTETPETTKKD